MTRDEFEELRRSPKTIEGDIAFYPYEQDAEVWVFEGIKVENHLGYTLFLNGAYDPRTGYIKFNFALKAEGRRQSGPICRLEVRGKVHRDAGRTHKQDLREPRCMRRNLPHAVARDELEKLGLRQVWETLCRQANIDHTGQFTEPPVKGRGK
ncbi:MAG TPA: hypothetical protein VJ739_08525 [Gemmataceae bacterium]|nr:hypothetical protein [Gemmataceae bacterium]